MTDKAKIERSALVVLALVERQDSFSRSQILRQQCRRYQSHGKLVNSGFGASNMA